LKGIIHLNSAVESTHLVSVSDLVSPCSQSWFQQKLVKH